jgi:hypothetical protein
MHNAFRTNLLAVMRVAVTAVSLTACVLLIALWVRSYWRADSMPISALVHIHGIRSTEGRVSTFHRKMSGRNRLDHQ